MPGLLELQIQEVVEWILDFKAQWWRRTSLGEPTALKVPCEDWAAESRVDTVEAQVNLSGPEFRQEPVRCGDFQVHPAGPTKGAAA